MGANGHAHVTAFVGGAVAVLALGVLISVGVAGAMIEPGAEWGGGLAEGEAAQLTMASAVVVAISGAAALLAVGQLYRGTRA